MQPSGLSQALPPGGGPHRPRGKGVAEGQAMPRADVWGGGGSRASRPSHAPPRSDWILLPLKRPAHSVSPPLGLLCSSGLRRAAGRGVLFSADHSVSGSVSLGVRPSPEARLFVVHPHIYLFFPAGEGLGRLLSLVLTLSGTTCVTGDLATHPAGVVVAPGGARPMEKEPLSVLPAAEGGSPFS